MKTGTGTSILIKKIEKKSSCGEKREERGDDVRRGGRRGDDSISSRRRNTTQRGLRLYANFVFVNARRRIVGSMLTLVAGKTLLRPLRTGSKRRIRSINSSSTGSRSIYSGSINRSISNDGIVDIDRQRSHKTSGKKPGQLIFLRHGQSTWNQQNIFIGMTDTPLTPDGVLEARVAGM